MAGSVVALWRCWLTWVSSVRDVLKLLKLLLEKPSTFGFCESLWLIPEAFFVPMKVSLSNPKLHYSP